jgi:hypothetical protein
MVNEFIADNEMARQIAEIWNRTFKHMREGRFAISGDGDPSIIIEDCLNTILLQHLGFKETAKYIRKMFKPLNLKLRDWYVSFSKGDKANFSVFLIKRRNN